MLKSSIKKKYNNYLTKYSGIFYTYNCFSMQQNIEHPNFIEKKINIENNYKYNYGLNLSQIYFNVKPKSMYENYIENYNNYNNKNQKTYIEKNIYYDSLIKNNIEYFKKIEENEILEDEIEEEEEEEEEKEKKEINININNNFNINFNKNYYNNNIYTNCFNNYFNNFNIIDKSNLNKNNSQNNVDNNIKILNKVNLNNFFVKDKYLYMKNNTFFIYNEIPFDSKDNINQNNITLYKKKDPKITYTHIDFYKLQTIIFKGNDIRHLYLKGAIFNNIPTYSIVNMIKKLKYLTTLDLSETNIDLYLFIKTTENDIKNNTNLKKLVLSDLTTYSTDFKSLFANFKYLKILKLINLKIINKGKENITMHKMFYGCDKLEDLDIRNINTSDVYDMSNMFENCIKLKFLNLTSLNLNAVKSTNSMFKNCQSLSWIIFNHYNKKIKAFYGNITDMQYMFDGCIKLKTLNFSAFLFKNDTIQESMFNNCINLQCIYIAERYKNRISDINYRFNRLCKKKYETEILIHKPKVSPI